ncbi:beta strand repeat-containing protein, partial [Segetibacter aerophilus]|uniref:beta strand repeat-containing protein n=1 Tax=Segetibacter aerophilus TaxID=670293 RepID=UPI001C3FDD9F
NTAKVVNIVNTTGGNKTLSGNLTSTATGLTVTGNSGGSTILFSGATKSFNTGVNIAVSLTTNTGSTINFSNGGLAITTTFGSGFNATGGGTISVTQDAGTSNTITSTTGIALNVVSTTIGSAGVTFRSINSNGAANGINLSSTGAGGLTVTGDGGGASNGSGGTISSATGKGIQLNSVSNISLNYMNITGGGNDGIDGTNVTGFTLTRSNLTNNGNADEEHGIEFANVMGTVTLTNSTIRGSFEHNFKITNTSGTINNLNVTDCTFDHLAIQSGAAGGNGFLVVTQGTSIITNAVVTGCTFRNNFGNGVLVNSENNSRIGLDNATSAATIGFKLANNTFDDNNIAIQFGVFHSSDMTVDIQSNTIINDGRRATSGASSTSHAIVVGSSAIALSGSSLNARIDGNVIGSNSFAGSGSSIGSGIRYIVQGLTTSTALINNNTIRQAPSGYGIEATFLGPQDDLGTVPVSDITVTNNNVDHRNYTFAPGSSDFPLPAIYIAADNQGATAAGAPTVRSDVRGNTVPTGNGLCTTGSCSILGTWIEVYEYTAASGPGIHQLVDAAPASANATAQLTSANTGSASANPEVALIAGPINLPPDL